MTLEELVIEAIENMSSIEIKELNNTYCENGSYMDDYIYINDEDFFNDNYSNSVIDAVRAASYGGYKFNDNYVQINGLGNLDSYDELDTNNLVDRVQVIAEYAIENDHLFGMFDWDELKEQAIEEEEED